MRRRPLGSVAAAVPPRRRDRDRSRSGAELVDAALQRAADTGEARRLSYVRASAEALPFAAGSFDLVTCQTLLIHVPRPAETLSEMLRVLRPGGTILLAEPNNQANQLVTNSVTARQSVDEQLRRLRFFLTCQQGKVALGEGNNSVADELPFRLSDLQVENVSVSIADRALPVVPPYSPSQEVLIEAELERVRRGMGPWPRPETRRYFIAGGGTPERFDHEWAARMEENAETAGAIERAEFWSPGGHLMYVISGTTRSVSA
jgi:SAM-dependent methyltransferase